MDDDQQLLRIKDILDRFPQITRSTFHRAVAEGRIKAAAPRRYKEQDIRAYLAALPQRGRPARAEREQPADPQPDQQQPSAPAKQPEQQPALPAKHAEDQRKQPHEAWRCLPNGETWRIGGAGRRAQLAIADRTVRVFLLPPQGDLLPPALAVFVLYDQPEQAKAALSALKLATQDWALGQELMLLERIAAAASSTGGRCQIKQPALPRDPALVF